jgi:hypothetical protein
MRRVDLIEATMQGWARLDATQRDRFFHAFLRAALRLDALGLKAWLRKRLRNPPLAAPIDPACLLADVDIALLLRAAGKAPGEAVPGRTGTRPMATRGQTLPPVFSAWIAIRSRDPASLSGIR